MSDALSLQMADLLTRALSEREALDGDKEAPELTLAHELLRRQTEEREAFERYMEENCWVDQEAVDPFTGEVV